MIDKLKFVLKRIGEKLWVKPLVTCVLSITIVFLAKTVDRYQFSRLAPEITTASIESMLSIVAASMLAVATFAVGSMVSAYASAGNNATPRSFSLVISDDVSQYALSSFIGTFIFSITALMALKNDFFDQGGRFAIFILTVLVIALVIVTFLRWVDRIARLGRLGGTIDKVEAATTIALKRRRLAPTLRGVSKDQFNSLGRPVYGQSIGYVQRVDVPALQDFAEKKRLKITLTALPGSFSAPGRPLARVITDSGEIDGIDTERIAEFFLIGVERTYDEDPRFGLVVLAEIASRALSPAINDPGTAIGIIGRLVRLFALWNEPVAKQDIAPCHCDRVAVPELSLEDMFDDAFSTIARDGAGAIEVVLHLQKGFQALASNDDTPMREVATQHAHLTLARAEKALVLPEDLAAAKQATITATAPIRHYETF